MRASNKHQHTQQRPSLCRKIELAATAAVHQSLDEIIHEAQTMKNYHHPNVLPLHCSFVTGQDLWMVMPYISGGSVLHIMKYAYPEVRASAQPCGLLSPFSTAWCSSSRSTTPGLTSRTRACKHTAVTMPCQAPQCPTAPACRLLLLAPKGGLPTQKPLFGAFALQGSG
eukprot:786139-Pelagomonas_calceolata.AAC.7